MRNPPGDVADRVVERVTAELAFPVSFTENALDADNETLLRALPGPTGHGPVAFVDSGLAEAWPGIEDRLEAYLEVHGRPLAAPPVRIPGGERCKDGWDEVSRVIEHLRQHRLCRHSAVICLGGGAVLDVVGLGASLVHRGVRLVRMPSTTVSQGDSGVGVKTGINLRGVKNYLGTFAAPYSVVCDFDLLRTLGRALVLDGVAEAFKVAAIKDHAFFDLLRGAGDRLGDGASEELRRLSAEAPSSTSSTSRAAETPSSSAAPGPWTSATGPDTGSSRQRQETCGTARALPWGWPSTRSSPGRGATSHPRSAT